MVVVWWSCGGCVVVVWWLCGGRVVVVWWSCGGRVAVEASGSGDSSRKRYLGGFLEGGHGGVLLWFTRCHLGDRDEVIQRYCHVLRRVHQQDLSLCGCCVFWVLCAVVVVCFGYCVLWLLCVFAIICCGCCVLVLLLLLWISGVVVVNKCFCCCGLVVLLLWVSGVVVVDFLCCCCGLVVLFDVFAYYRSFGDWLIVCCVVVKYGVEENVKYGCCVVGCGVVWHLVLFSSQTSSSFLDAAAEKVDGACCFGGSVCQLLLLHCCPSYQLLGVLHQILCRCQYAFAEWLL